ncbi:hypothetical protein ACFYUV_34355 [Nonomuraea sp. NPDC003560]|uniref:hypothetical protein n=1 Tax=Nonomuraea sp. NPDC003560 TaxID=3364341 RepID=UPI00368377A6
MHIVRAIKAPLSGLACAATLTLGVTSFPAPASATVTQGQAVPASVAAGRTTAPACIERSVSKKRKTVWISNRCGRTMKVKVVVKHGPDSYCRTLRDSETIYYPWHFGSYDRTVNC